MPSCARLDLIARKAKSADWQVRLSLFLYSHSMDSEKIDILMVDDDPGTYRLVKLILAEAKQPVDFVIEPAGTLAEGLERLAEENYDLVLLDLGLPDSSGVKSVEEVYRACPNPNTDAHISRETLENI